MLEQRKHLNLSYLESLSRILNADFGVLNAFIVVSSEKLERKITRISMDITKSVLIPEVEGVIKPRELIQYAREKN